MNHCIFCGPTARKITEEHIWPKWISKVLRQAGITKYDVFSSRHSPTKLLSQKTRRSNILDLTAKVICTKCNHEILGELENDFAKPILKPMIQGNTTRLSVVDLAVLSAWIMKMAMVYEFTDSRAKFFSQVEREHFLEVLEPVPNTWIWLGQNGSRHIAGAVQHTLFAETTPGYTAHIHVLTCVIGRVAFQLLTRGRHMTSPAATMVPILDHWRPATVLMFPSSDSVQWPPPQYLADDSLKPFADRWGGRTRGDRF